MAGNWASAILVSCMHNTSGWAYSSHSSTRGMRAFRELTFQVAMRTVLVLVRRGEGLDQFLPQLGVLRHEAGVDDLLLLQEVDLGRERSGRALQVQHL